MSRTGFAPLMLRPVGVQVQIAAHLDAPVAPAELGLAAHPNEAVWEGAEVEAVEAEGTLGGLGHPVWAELCFEGSV